jgi:DnaJ-class molecular chaperone
MIDFAKTGPKPRRAKQCSTCRGEGTVPIDPADRRVGDTVCPNCDGNGEIS